MPGGGDWSGNFITGDLFSSQQAAGTQTRAVYTVKNLNDCISNAAVDISVERLPELRIESSGAKICVGDVLNLNAISNGGGVAWFSSTTSTTPLSPDAGLVNGATYYADNATGNCGTRQPVSVTIYAAPTGQNFQGVCVDNPLQATIASLIANGNNIRWYTTPSGGTPLPTTTVLTDNTIYYASQTNPDTGCETSRLAVFVNVGVVPVPSGPAIQSFCLSLGNTPTVANLQASGINNWYATVSSAVVLDSSTPLINGETYYQVRWKDCSADMDTWLKHEDFIDYGPITKYEKQLPKSKVITERTTSVKERLKRTPKIVEIEEPSKGNSKTVAKELIEPVQVEMNLSKEQSNAVVEYWKTINRTRVSGSKRNQGFFSE
jgi:hypothetical protein